MKATSSLLRSIQSIAHQHGWQADLYRTLSSDASNDAYPNTLTTGTPNAVIFWRPQGKPSILHFAFLWEIEGMNEDQIAHKIRSVVSHVEEAA